MYGEVAEDQKQALADFNTALQIFARNRWQLNWAFALMHRGTEYKDHLTGIRTENQERALADYSAALEIFIPELFPRKWSLIHMNMDIVYAQRLNGNRAENVERALVEYNAALKFFKLPLLPFDWALNRMQRGIAYHNRIRGDKAQNQEQAIVEYNAALTVFTRQDYPSNYAQTLHNRANIYLERIGGDQAENTELNKALEVRTHESMPYYWAESHFIRGIIDTNRLTGEVVDNLWHALDDFNAALEFYTREAVKDAERMEILGEFTNADLFLRDVRVLLNYQPPELASAVCTLEEGRAHILRAALDLDLVNLSSISGSEAHNRATAFINARNNWQKSQNLMAYPPAVHELNEDRRRQEAAYLELIRARDAIRKYDDPDFLSPAPTSRDIARAIPVPDHALVYLVSGYKEGYALIVTRDGGSSAQVEHLRLPKLSDEAISDLLLIEASHTLQTAQGKITAKVPTGGLALGQMAVAFKILQAWGANLRETEAALPKGSGFQQTARVLLDAWSKSQPRLLDQPFSQLRRKERQDLATIFESTLLNLELRRSLLQLGKLGLCEIADTLSK